MSSNSTRISDVLEALIDGIVEVRVSQARIEKKVDGVAASQVRLERALGELSRDQAQIRERLFEESRRRAGLGRTVLEHDVDLALIKGGRRDD